MALLEARNLSVRFAALQAVDDVELDVDAGTIVGLIGPNGAGKTTTFNALTGVQPCTGTVTLDGLNVSKMPIHKRAALGMSRTFQRLEVFGSMTVFDNIRAAAEISGRVTKRGMSTASADAHAIVERLGLVAVADRRADALPTGQGRLVELGRALATQPKVILLDEPASGLNEAETLRLAAVLRSLRDEGIGVLLVEHDIDLVMELCSTIYALNFGQLITSGTPAEIRANEAVQAAYLGAAV